ncbi:hypothetical protein MDA_GLEAN10017860 [Myotis davidii]|uniref:Uncharacterized protein n=1 Tax=Myotis davidii TaxID=225400 RepID=L5LD75_MYODS|nr:hypothetical protein MDA_GLEAN10017860 [Myotis davidii]
MAWPARTMVRITPPTSGFLAPRVARMSFDMMRGSLPSFTRVNSKTDGSGRRHLVSEVTGPLFRLGLVKPKKSRVVSVLQRVRQRG